MTEQAAPAQRAGQSSLHQDDAQSHILVVFVDDHPGSLDRVVGVLRRRRANMQTLTIGRSELPTVVRITVVVDDSEVGVEQLVEQLRKVANVRQVVNLSAAQAVARELALIKVSSTSSSYSEIIELGHQFGAHLVDVTPETVTLEVTGSEEKVTKIVDLLQPYGIREIARTGYVAMTRGPGDSSEI
jgi:acetolactate synthase I/III small subunit